MFKTTTDIKTEIARRGLNCLKIQKAWRVLGPGVDIIVADLKLLRPDDLRPYIPYQK